MRIYTAGEAGGCECILGSFEENGAGGSTGNCRQGEGFLMVPATLPTFFVLKEQLVTLSCFFPFQLLLFWLLVVLCPA